MNKFLKKGLGFVLTLSLALSSLPTAALAQEKGLMQVEDTAAIEAKLDTIQSSIYPAGSTFEYSGFAGGIQCFGFAKKIQYLLYGNIASWSYNGTAGNHLVTVDRISPPYTADKVAALMAKAKPGDLIQADVGYNRSQHSMIFDGLNNNGTFNIYDGNYDRANGVDMRQEPYGTWSGDDYAHISVLRNTAYPKTLAAVGDTDAPVVSNLRVDYQDDNGYRVACDISDDVAVKEVYFPTWTNENGQDDLVWYKGVVNGNTAYSGIYPAQHNNERAWYTTMAYAYDYTGKMSAETTPVSTAFELPISVDSFDAYAPAGQYVGTNVDLSASASYGKGALSYRFGYSLNGAETTVRDSAPDTKASFTLNAAGNHTLFVDVTDTAGQTSRRTIDNFTVSNPKQDDMNVSYRTHIQDHGWQRWTAQGDISGTLGEGKRLEALEISMNSFGSDLGIEYQTHIQNTGWQDWRANGSLSGTENQGLRLEGLRVRLTGALADKYDIYYTVHAENIGWLGWAKNGEDAGTSDYGYRLEGLQVKLVKKGEAAPAPIAGSNPNTFLKPGMISYQTHVENIGWQTPAHDGAISGTHNQGLRLEGLKMAMADQPYVGDIQYKTYVENIGWQDYVGSTGLSGTENKGLRIEGLSIQLTDEMAQNYDLYYQVHAQNFGWLGWAKNGEDAGTADYGARLEGLRVMAVKKGSESPKPLGNESMKAFYKNTEAEIETGTETGTEAEAN